jgi:hypothetical protein
MPGESQPVPQPSVTGTWRFSMHFPANLDLSYKLTQTDNNVTGTSFLNSKSFSVTGTVNYPHVALQGSLDGENLDFSGDFEQPNNISGTVTWRGEKYVGGIWYPQPSATGKWNFSGHLFAPTGSMNLTQTGNAISGTGEVSSFSGPNTPIVVTGTSNYPGVALEGKNDGTVVLPFSGAFTGADSMEGGGLFFSRSS